jgi:dTDP-glucose 4,6-dehydratase
LRVLVTGGAGFLGSHLCDLLIARGDTVVCLDDLSTGRTQNVEHHAGSPLFTFIHDSVLSPIDITGSFDGVVHLASPASPPAYLARPIFTLRTGSEGTRNALEFIPSRKVTGVTSIRPVRAAFTTRPSVTPRR